MAMLETSVAAIGTWSDFVAVLGVHMLDGQRELAPEFHVFELNLVLWQT